MNALAKVLIRETPIDWDRYVLTEEDTQRFVDPRTLVASISDVLHGRGTRQGATLPWAGLHDKVRLPGGHLSIWAGINFHGKSGMLKQLSIHLAKSGERVCGAFLEEQPEESMADITQLAIPDVDVRECDDYIDVACSWASGKIWLYNQTRMMEPHRVLALIAYAAKEKRCTHFILDSLMRTGLAQDDYEGQRVFANQLTNYAMQLNIHIHLVHHIVKVDETQVPGRESIRGTGALTDQAHHVFIVWRDVNEDKSFDAPDGLLVVAKNRGIRPANWIGKVQMFMHRSGQFMRNKTDKPMLFIGSMTA
jgi:twinkle protein